MSYVHARGKSPVPHDVTLKVNVQANLQIIDESANNFIEKIAAYKQKKGTTSMVVPSICDCVNLRYIRR